MKCPRCQHENPVDATFCDECGARLEAACAACGEANRLGAKFCRKCGQPLIQRGTPARDAAQLGPPRAYTPKHLAEKILTSKAALEGERKQVTVLFADLKGLRGEAWDKALTYCRQAGEKAVGRSAYREAVGYFEHALGTLPYLPEQLVKSHYHQALGLAEELNLRPLVAHCHLDLGKALPSHGQARSGSRAPHRRDDDVPRDGHAVLA